MKRHPSGSIHRWRALVICLPLTLAAAAPAGAGGVFTRTGDMTSPRGFHGTALLRDGEVLVVGGVSDAGVLVSTAELYDPASGSFSLTGSPADARVRPTVVGLADGRVLVLGGRGETDGGVFSSAEIYDPATGTFTKTGDMLARRYVPSAVRLDDGKVLVASGFNFDEGVLKSAELYDPETGMFTATGSLNVPRTEPHGAMRLADGRVLIAGGTDAVGPVASAEIYDPATGTFSTTGDLLHPLEGHSLALLDDGEVLVVGGGDGVVGHPDYAEAELYDPITGTFTSTGRLTFPRDLTTASRLADGRVLVAGGQTWSSAGVVVVAAAEIYEPASGTFESAGDLAVPLYEPEAVVLADHRVLLAGGFDAVDDLPTASAELFTPAPSPSDVIFANGFDTAAVGSAHR